MLLFEAIKIQLYININRAIVRLHEIRMWCKLFCEHCRKVYFACPDLMTSYLMMLYMHEVENFMKYQHSILLHIP